MSEPLTIRPATAADEARWDAYVLAHPASEKHHLWGWRRVIERTFGHATPYLLAEGQGGAVAGVLPLAQVKSLLFGNHLVSLPFCNYGGILAGSPEAERALFEEAVGLATRLGASQLELRHLNPLAWFEECRANGGAAHYSTRRHKVSMRLALPETPDALWESFKSKLRSQVRKPAKEGCTAAIGGMELMADFYRVFAENMRDLGTPVYPVTLFENVMAEFGGTSHICCVYHAGSPVAAGLVVGFKERLEIPWASSLRSHNSLAPNMLLYWSLLEFACRSGYRTFDFGRSTAGASTHRFKEQWGARPVELSWHCWSQNAAPADLSPGNKKFELAIAVWRHLPLKLANNLGPSIVKYLP